MLIDNPTHIRRARDLVASAADQPEEHIMDVTLIIDPDTCIGYGECVLTEDPDAVELGPNGTARVICAALDETRARRICEVCPTGAI